MHEISSYGKTHKHTQTHRQLGPITIHCAAASPARSVLHIKSSNVTDRKCWVMIEELERNVAIMTVTRAELRMWIIIASFWWRLTRVNLDLTAIKQVYIVCFVVARASPTAVIQFLGVTQICGDVIVHFSILHFLVQVLVRSAMIHESI